MKKFIVLGVVVLIAIALYIVLWVRNSGTPEVAQRTLIEDSAQQAKVSEFLTKAIKAYNNQREPRQFMQFWAKVDPSKFKIDSKKLGKTPLASPQLVKLSRSKLNEKELYAFVKFPGQDKNIQFVLRESNNRLLLKGITKN